jgi:sulfatase modifying factor 1
MSVYRIFVMLGLILCGSLIISSCGRGKSSESRTTGWKYNDQDWGGFEDFDYEGQITGPNLVPIQGGTFVMGLTDEDVIFQWNNVQRRVTVSSFYMDETEVANIDWRHYTFWLQRVIQDSEVYRAALPDSLVWREELAYNEPLVQSYFRHPAYDDYPVVGVSWEQCVQYSRWRTDRVNEMILIERGILNPNPEQNAADHFSTDSYLADRYQGDVRKNLKDISTGGERSVRQEDGIFLPEYRLPTEAEWEYAALALIGNRSSQKDELITDRRIYPWNGNTARYKKRDRYQGRLLANFKRSRGDYMGTAGNLNDVQPFPGPVKSNYPNDYGLYNMAGNVNEWVADVYRDLTTLSLRDEETQDLNPYRGNVFQQVMRDETGSIMFDSLGRVRYEQVADSTIDRDNYNRSDVVDYQDDDREDVTYETNVHTLISDGTRVYKGGSWADRLYWLSPGARRYLDQNKASNTIGFRNAMNRIGDQFVDPTSVNQFKSRTKPIKRRY